MFHCLPDFVSSSPQRSVSNIKQGYHDTSVSYSLLCRRAHMNKMLIKLHLFKCSVLYVFTLHLKACDHTKFNFSFLLYDLGTIFKGLHNFMVTALGHSRKWP